MADAAVPGFPVVTVPVSKTGVFPSDPSVPSVPSLPVSPFGNTRLILYFGLPDMSVPFAVTVADAFVPFSTVPISKTGVLPSTPSSPVSPLGKDKEMVYMGDPSASFSLNVIVAEACSPGLSVVTVPASNFGVFPSDPSVPSVPSFPLSPFGKTRSNL